MDPGAGSAAHTLAPEPSFAHMTCHSFGNWKSSAEPREREQVLKRAGSKKAREGRGGQARPALLGLAGAAGPSALRRRAALNITPEFSIISS